MGLDISAIKILLSARAGGTSFKKTLMLGRQGFSCPRDLILEIRARGLTADAAADWNYAEPLFKSLGAEKVMSMDNSKFEGAEFIHDLNQPLDPSARESFDVVYDGGTLEHVFNLPVAFKSVMELLNEGGTFFSHTVANNMCGHGFYQFTPELFFRVFSPENGFKIERLLIANLSPFPKWYQVSDPDVIRQRVELITFLPTVMFIQAKRVKIVPIFAKMPQQSDYTVMWKADMARPKPIKGGKIKSVFKAVRTGLEFYHRQSFRNRKYFTRVKL